jgi:hypothetical protein
MTDKTISEPASLSEERLRELRARMIKWTCVDAINTVMGGTQTEWLQIIDAELSRRSQGNASQNVQAQGEVRKILLDIEEHSPDDFARSMARQARALLQRQPSEVKT